MKRIAQIDRLRADWGRRIRTARLGRGLTVVELARLADIDQGNLSRLERGMQGASDEMRLSIAIALGKQVHELFPYPDITSPRETQRPVADAPKER